MQEIFKDIEGYKGLYQVSNQGRVKSLGNSKSRKEKILKPYKDHKGYLNVYLCKNGQRGKKFIHQLVATAFLPNPMNLKEVNHKDESPLNNFVWINENGSIDQEKSNLEWCNHWENMNWGTRNERISKALTNGKLSKPVFQFDRQGNFIKEYPSLMEIQRQNGFKTSSISKCCKNKLKQAYGYMWKYKSEA